MLLSSRYQEVFALLVPSCCDKSGTRPGCYHLVTRLMQQLDFLQVVSTRLIQAARYKFVLACCHQLVNNLLRADDYRLVGTTCFESVSLVNFVTKLLPDFSKLCKQKCEHIFLARKIESEIESIQRRALRIFPEHK